MDNDNIKYTLQGVFRLCEIYTNKKNYILLVNQDIYNAIFIEIQKEPKLRLYPLQESKNTKPSVYGIEVFIKNDFENNVIYQIVSDKDPLYYEYK
ncbi:MAG: hypothetical protein WAT79_08705 [Saprospiraceae bacterium]|jgi:hypothetical protein